MRVQYGGWCGYTGWKGMLMHYTIVEHARRARGEMETLLEN